MPSESLPGELLAAQTAVETLDRQFVFHPFTKLDDHLSSDAPVIVEGKGTTLRDSRGNVYLDAMAGLWCVNVGYGRREIAEALARRGAAARLLPRVLVDGDRPARARSPSA